LFGSAGNYSWQGLDLQIFLQVDDFKDLDGKKFDFAAVLGNPAPKQELLRE